MNKNQLNANRYPAWTFLILIVTFFQSEKASCNENLALYYETINNKFPQEEIRDIFESKLWGERKFIGSPESDISTLQKMIKETPAATTDRTKALMLNKIFGYYADIEQIFSYTNLQNNQTKPVDFSALQFLLFCNCARANFFDKSGNFIETKKDEFEKIKNQFSLEMSLQFFVQNFLKVGSIKNNGREFIKDPDEDAVWFQQIEDFGLKRIIVEEITKPLNNLKNSLSNHENLKKSAETEKNSLDSDKKRLPNSYLQLPLRIYPLSFLIFISLQLGAHFLKLATPKIAAATGGAGVILSLIITNTYHRNKNKAKNAELCKKILEQDATIQENETKINEINNEIAETEKTLSNFETLKKLNFEIFSVQ